MLHLIVTPDPRVDGVFIGRVEITGFEVRSRHPLIAAARELRRWGVPGQTQIVMRHADAAQACTPPRTIGFWARGGSWDRPPHWDRYGSFYRP